MVKVTRIARVLRFLRIIKLFRRIKKVSSPMARRHVATVATVSVAVVVFALLLFTVLSDRRVSPASAAQRPEDVAVERQARVTAHLKSLERDPVSFVQALDTLEKTEATLLVVRFRGETLFTRYSNATYSDGFGPEDYGYRREGDLELFFDQRALTDRLALESLLCFAIVLSVVLAYLLGYGPYFALTVTDPVHVMRRGLAEPHYNLEVKIPEKHRDDDVFRLAELYNKRFLPLKDRSHGLASPPSLDLDDVGEIQELPDSEDW